MDILSFLSAKLKSDQKTIRAYLHKATRRYRVYNIPKRNGKGTRTIAQPTRVLKTIQLLVLKEFFQALPIHDAAMAYRKGIGIKANARAHVKSSYLLKMDFENFFPSIVPDDFVDHTHRHINDVSIDDEFVIRNLFFCRLSRFAEPSLSIGAPSSPFISNTLMNEFDFLVSTFAGEHESTYTRYADDLTFTTRNKNILYEFPKYIAATIRKLKYPSLEINDNKTVFSSKKSNRHVTGLVLSNQEKVSLGRKRKRFIRSLVHEYKKGEMDIASKLHLEGLIAFAWDVEPDFINKLKLKYGHETISLLLKKV